MSDNKHENYEILNLIGYGLAKFNGALVKEFGFKTKADFYEYIVRCGVAETIGTVKNRQDLFDPFFDNGRKGWWQKGDAYIHRKKFIDSLFGDYEVKNYTDIVKLYLKKNFRVADLKPIEAKISPIIKSKFRQLQLTGKEAELYFKDNYRQIESFKSGILEDATMLGDGYDFQIQIETKYFLVDVKGVRKTRGEFRMTDKEFIRAEEYKNDYGVIVVSNLDEVPKMTAIFNPIANLVLERREKTRQEISYHSKPMKW